MGFRIGRILQQYAHGTTHEYSRLHNHRKVKSIPTTLLNEATDNSNLISGPYKLLWDVVKREPRASLMAGSQPAAVPWSANILTS